METRNEHPEENGLEVAAVCGLYCKACTMFIATAEDPERLESLAARFGISTDAIQCFGCRSHKKGPYCATCKMTACAAERGIDFCAECAEYPCHDLKQFQSERPHRIELWDDLEQIRSKGYQQWLEDVRANYACSQCGCVNSAYDMKCRQCGEEPSSNYVARHRKAIEPFLKDM